MFGKLAALDPMTFSLKDNNITGHGCKPCIEGIEFSSVNLNLQQNKPNSRKFIAIKILR